MPLNLSNRDQNTGHLFYNRRLRAAITRFSVRMKHDDRKQQAALALSVVFVVLGCGWMALLHFIKPSGLSGESAIVGNRDTGAVYARIDGRLYPALNLASARLATGAASDPRWVKAPEIAKYPTGPMVGIPGIPDDLAVSAAEFSAWAVCDTAPLRSSGGSPVVTAIGGQLSGGGRAAPMSQSQAVLATHRGAAYLIWQGRRTRIDLADRAVTMNLGLDLRQTRPVPISTALFDAIPATEPLVPPAVPGAGTPSRWVPGSVVGRVLTTVDAGGEVNGFYVLHRDGVQKVTSFVANLLRTADSHGVRTPQLISPDTLLGIPDVAVLDVDHYPPGAVSFVDTEAHPVTCVSWTKRMTDRHADRVLFSGSGLPTPPSLDGHLVELVREAGEAGSVQAQQTLMLPGAANFVASTGPALHSDTRESLFWVSPQGVRYGIDWDQPTLDALGLDPRQAVQAPWPILRIFAAGPAISRAGALVARDSIDPSGSTTRAVPVAGTRGTGG